MAIKIVVEVETALVSNFDELNDFHTKMVQLIEASSPTPAYEDVAVETTSDGITVSWEV